MPRVKRTRHQVVDRALALAGVVGLENVTLGVLAADLALSKSGLFAHFRSKEALQLAVLAEAVERFTATVVAPALTQPRGEPRVRALFEHHLAWVRAGGGDGDAAAQHRCIFMALSQEYDDRPGEVRDALVRSQRDWRAALAHAARLAVGEGHFRADLDVDQFAFELVGIAMTYQQSYKLLADERATAFAHAAFDGLLARAAPRRRAR
ncbi:MAG: TetR/AcrR family transcriptional regulator [Gemmatirosa sp.]|nr:TetR/AcrR family transcriptional regulator [Gemmatirosa sp.]